MSFEKENHKALKHIDFLEKLEDRNMFNTVFNQFDEMVEEKKKDKINTRRKPKPNYK